MSRNLLRWSFVRRMAILLALVAAFTAGGVAQERREREPNEVYAGRRAKIAAQVDGPVILWGFTGREESSQSYVFAQEDNFYYLTGHNEEGAGLVILPAPKNGEHDGWDGPREALREAVHAVRHDERREVRALHREPREKQVRDRLRRGAGEHRAV